MSRLDALAFAPPFVCDAFETMNKALQELSLSLYSELQPLTPKESDPALREGAAQSAAATVLILEELRANLAMTADAIVTDLIAKLLDFGSSIDLAGAGKHRISRSNPSTKYDNQMVLARLGAAISDELLDPETGEIPPVGIICQRTTELMSDAVGAGTPGFKGWRSTALKTHGIDLKEYELPSEKGRLRMTPERFPNTKPTEEP